MLKSYKWWGRDGMGWMGRKSLKGVILRAPLCGVNNYKLSIVVHEYVKSCYRSYSWINLKGKSSKKKLQKFGLFLTRGGGRWGSWDKKPKPLPRGRVEKGRKWPNN